VRYGDTRFLTGQAHSPSRVSEEASLVRAPCTILTLGVQRMQGPRGTTEHRSG
jgi:hypothetical protein